MLVPPLTPLRTVVFWRRLAAGMLALALLVPGAAFCQSSPTITLQPQSQSVVAPTNASFSVTAGGQGPLSYQWSFNGASLANSTHIGGATNSLLTISNVTSADTGSYAVQVSNRHGSRTSSVATLTVLLPAAIVSPPASQAVFLGSNATFTVNATGTAPLAYQWYFNGTPLTTGSRINGATTSTLNIPILQLSDAGNYQVVVSNAFKVVTSQTAMLSVAVSSSAVMRFVNLSSPQPQPPYTSWSSAATTIQDALDVSNPGDQILVTNGTYQTGGRIVSGALSNRVAVTQPVTVQSVNGPAATAIRGYQVPGPIFGDSAMRGVYLTNGAALIGFTVSQGATRAAGDVLNEQSGGGIFCASTSAIVSNCIVTANAAHGTDTGSGSGGGGAGGIFSGTLFNCQVLNNAAPTGDGGGACNSVLNNCLLAQNSAGYGGGAYGSTLNACIVSNNAASQGGGCYGYNSVLNSCLLIGNSATYGGAVLGTTLNNCTVTGNSASSQGGGAWNASAINSILYFNSAPSGANWFTGSYPYCCTTPAYDTGAITAAPLFANQAAGDFHLQPISPCISAGNNGSVSSTTDLDGNPRLIGATVDMGAFEYQAPTIVVTTPPASQAAATGQTAGFSVAAISAYPLSYQWLFNGAPLTNGPHFAGATTTSLVVSNTQLSDAGSYSVQIANPFLTVTSAVATLSVFMPPSFAQQPANQTAIVGSNAVFSATANGTALHYQWYFKGTALADSTHITGALTNTLNLSSVQSTDAGSYYLVATNPVGVATSMVATLTVIIPPSFTQQPTNQTVALGSNPTLSATVAGTAPSYQWYFNDTALADSVHIAGSLTSALNILNAQNSDAGSYYLVVSNPVCVLTSAVAALTVMASPSFTQQPANQAVALGSNATFSATATGPALSYQWYFNGTALADSSHITGSFTNSLSISNVQNADAGSYYLVLSNPVGVLTSAVATLTVLVPPTVFQQPLGRSVPAGLPTTFTAAGTGTVPLAYQWQLNGTNIANATNTTYTIAAVGTNDLGAYHLVVSNAAAVAVSTDALLTFGPVAAWGRNDALQCLPPPGLSNVVAIAGGLTYSMALRADGTVVAWGLSKGIYLPAGLSNVVAISASSTDAGLALRADGSVISWNSTPAAPAGLSNQVAVAAGYNYGLGLSAAGVAEGWSPTSPAIPTVAAANVPAGLTKVSALAAGIYQSVALRADGTVAVWGSGAGTNLPAGLTNAVAVGSGYKHGLALRADGTVAAWGMTSATNVPAGLTNVAAIAAGGYAQGNGQSMAVLSNGLVRAWGDNAFSESTVPGGLSNVVAAACGGYHSLALVADGRPLLLKPPVGGTAFSGSSFTLAGVATGTAPLSYQWLFNGTNLAGATSSALTLAAIQASDAGTYQLVVTNALGAIASVPVPVTVLDSAPFFVGPPAPTNTPPVGNPFKLGAAVAGSGPLQLQWLWNGQSIPGATTDTLAFNPLSHTNVGSYTLVASNAFGVVTSTVALLWPVTVLAWGGPDEISHQTTVPFTLTNAVAVSAAYYNSLALRGDGTAQGWGYSFPPSPTVIPGFSNLVEVAAGQTYSLGLTTTGTVVGYGFPSIFLAGLSNIVALEVDNNSSTFLRADGTLARMNGGGTLSFPATGTNVIALARAYQGYAALRADGTVFYNNSDLRVSNVLGMAFSTSISGSELFLKQDGTMQSVGLPVLPPTLSNVLDVAMIAGNSLALRSNGTPVSFSNPAGGGPVVAPAVASLAAVDGGNAHFLGLLSEQPFPRVLLPTALNTSAYVVSSKSSPQWFGQSVVTHDGVAAAQSASIERNTQSSMRTLVTGPVTVSFWWKVSSQTNHHTLAFSAGGVVLTNLSGEVDWQPCTVAVPAGNQMLQWTYTKDASPSAGQDAAWVDQLVITPVPPTILTQPASQTVRGGTNVVLQVNATGTPPLTYSWFKNGVTPVGPNSPGLALFNVTRTNSGTYSVIVTNVAGSVTSSNAVLVIHVPQLLGTPVRQPDGTLLFSSQDADGGLLSSADLATLQVQTSTNLVDWTPLPGALSLTNGRLQVQDPGATNSSARFYRIVENW